MSGLIVETTLDLGRSPEEVFDYLADTRSFKAVDPALVEFAPEGRLEVGMAGRFLHRRGGLPARTKWHVRELDRPRHLLIEIRGMGYGMTEDVALEATATGTRARFVEHVWPTSLPGRVLVALSGGIMRRDLRARAERLATILDADVS